MKQKSDTHRSIDGRAANTERNVSLRLVSPPGGTRDDESHIFKRQEEDKAS